jgi:ATP-dependent DNA helicase RecG
VRPADLKILVQEGEGTTLEFKENLPASLARDLVAMANTIGGRILLGVRDDGTVVGVKDSNSLRARIQDIARNCDPPVQVVVEPVANVVVVHVRESDAKPVQCADGFFWRQGAATQKLSRDEIRDFFRSEGAVRFDLSPCPRFRYPQDFDHAKFNAWLKLSGITGKPRAEDVLVNIEAAERAGGKLLFRNAGVLFFAKNVRHFFNQAYITCLLAKGSDKVHILDRKDFDGGVVADIEDALRFIERNTRLAYRIEHLKREEIHEYPMKALREAITNAVMHRDWFIEGANVFVEIYDDRIEVGSPGGLPKGMTLADLGRKSVRRNALIADLLHRMGFIEKAGTGVKRIRDEARDRGLSRAGLGGKRLCHDDLPAQRRGACDGGVPDTSQAPGKYPTSHPTRGRTCTAQVPHKSRPCRRARSLAGSPVARGTPEGSRDSAPPTLPARIPPPVAGCGPHRADDSRQAAEQQAALSADARGRRLSAETEGERVDGEDRDYQDGTRLARQVQRGRHAQGSATGEPPLPGHRNRQREPRNTRGKEGRPGDALRHLGRQGGRHLRCRLEEQAHLGR